MTFSREKKLPKEIVEELEKGVEKALERPTTTGGIRGLARKLPSLEEMDKTLSLELKDQVNQFLGRLNLNQKEQNVTKLFIIHKLSKKAPQEDVLKFFNALKPEVEILAKNIKELNKTDSGAKTLETIVGDQKWEELEGDLTNQELDLLIDVYGPGIA